MYLNESVNACFHASITSLWDKEVLSDYGQATYCFKDVAKRIAQLHILFECAGIEKGDRIAICGRNQAGWAMAFLSVLTYGCVVVPVLHEFHPDQVHDIVNHSESKLLFVGDQVCKKLDAETMPELAGVIVNQDFSLLVSRNDALSEAHAQLDTLFAQRYPDGFGPEHIKPYHADQPEELAIINYTSGTTSNSKGVMIPYRAVWSNIAFADHVFGDHADVGSNILSLLPMAHTFGMSFEFLYEFIKGVHINFLTRMPTPTILLKALADVKPVVLVCVPLIIEKIVRKAILPKMNDWRIKPLLYLPIIGGVVKRRVREGLQKALGGNTYEVIIGGSALNNEVEKVLRDIGFNYTVGYGATECAPIIAYEDWHHFVPGSCGKVAPRMEIKIDSQDPHNVPGEIMTRGMNVMIGYYKNDEATSQTLVDGWYHTGDLGIVDKEGNLFIKGRKKNMLLASNGQNVYPEEIEDKLASMPLVAECLLVQREDKFCALVYPDMEQARLQHLSKEDLVALMEKNRKELNPLLPAYAQISKIILQEQEFEKTPKKSIKRFLYN